MSAAGWFIVLLAFALANLPFMTARLFAIVPLPDGRKHSGWRLAELIAWYGVVGAFGRLLEARAGNVFEQDWPFYAVTFCLFLVLAFPGFCYRYLITHRYQGGHQASKNHDEP